MFSSEKSSAYGSGPQRRLLSMSHRSSSQLAGAKRSKLAVQQSAFLRPPDHWVSIPCSQALEMMV